MVDRKSKPPHFCKSNPNLRLRHRIGLVFLRVRSVWIFQSTIFEVIGLPHSSNKKELTEGLTYNDFDRRKEALAALFIRRH